MTRDAFRAGSIAALVALVGAAPSAHGDESSPEPIARWLFDESHVEGPSVRADRGDWSGNIIGGAGLDAEPALHALRLDGASQSVLVAGNPGATRLPSQSITVEAWVAVERPQDWGGIIGAVQDNGDYEKGWLLGFRNDRFTMALSSKGNPRLTYLTTEQPFVPGEWHHVTGTYDGKTLRIYVDGRLDGESSEQNGPIDYPPAFFFEIGAYHDDDEYYRTRGRIFRVSVWDRALSADQVSALYRADRGLFPELFEIAVGPYVEHISRDSAVIEWRTDEAVPSHVVFGAAGLDRRVDHPAAKTQHRVTLHGLLRDTVYSFAVQAPAAGDSAARSSRVFHWDTTFNYALPDPSRRPSPWPRDGLSAVYSDAAERILHETGVRKGYCLVLGAERGRLAYELATRSRLKIVALESDPKKVAEARRSLDAAGLYGLRVSIHRGTLADIEYGDYVANLIVSDTALLQGVPPSSAAEAFRVLRPCGGAICLLYRGSGDAAAVKPGISGWFAGSDLLDDVRFFDDGTLGAVYRRPKLPGAGEWTHQYGLADNSACSKDELVRGRMEVLWWGRPGPRPMPDRGARNPAPVSANGRLFVQGDRVLFGIDAYNGTILWSLAIPAVRRSNIPRDSSNMVATDDYLYLATGAYCQGFDAQTGARRLLFELPRGLRAAEGGKPTAWGYLGIVGDTLIGSGVRKGAAYTGDGGEWFDGPAPEETAKVTSDFIFALDRYGRERRWSRRQGLIVNSTITASDGRLYFVESRNPAARSGEARRLTSEIASDHFLLALDLETGNTVWEKPGDFSACERVMYVSSGRGALTVVGSSDRYHMWAFDTGDGELLWRKESPWKRDHHGGAIQHPVIVGDSLYLVDKAYDLRTGRVLRSDLPDRRGCGTMAASLNSFVYRHHFHGMWDLSTNERTEFRGIRSGCWLGIIPSGGLVLAPETSSGCFCTHSIQISVAYLPSGR